jgi:hypothetical protein
MSPYCVQSSQRGCVGLGWTCLVFLLLQVCSCLAQQSDSSTCSSTLNGFTWKYEDILASDQYNVMRFDDLPGFTRSVSKHNYALITPESHVWAKNPVWCVEINSDLSVGYVLLNRIGLWRAGKTGQQRISLVQHLDQILQCTLLT